MEHQHYNIWSGQSRLYDCFLFGGAPLFLFVHSTLNVSGVLCDMSPFSSKKKRALFIWSSVCFGNAVFSSVLLVSCPLRDST